MELLKILNHIFTADLKDEYEPMSNRRTLVQDHGVYLKKGRDYGEFCTDQIEETALELYMLGKLDDENGSIDDENGSIDELRKKIEDRNPHTKIFQEGIVKVASKKEAVSPPGWGGTVEKMKKDHPEIDNPFALAWDMYNKGYEPHYPEKKKKKKKSHNFEQIISNVMNPLREQRDYGEGGKDQIEKQVMELDEIPEDLAEAMKRRKK